MADTVPTRTREDVINVVLDGIEALLDRKGPVTEEQRRLGREAARASLMRHSIKWDELAASDLTTEEIKMGLKFMWKESLS